MDGSRLRWQQQRKFAHPQWRIWNSASGILLSGIFMTISFLISNNLLFVYQQGGKDAASPPLISTSISKLTRLIFHPQDGPLLTHRMYGDQRIEPEFYAPIIPLILVNGTRQIGI